MRTLIGLMRYKRRAAFSRQTGSSKQANKGSEKHASIEQSRYNTPRYLIAMGIFFCANN